MKKAKKYLLDFTVDKLTNSIENVISKDSFKTEVLPVTPNDLKGITKKNGWNFDWKTEYKQVDRTVYKLVIVGNVNVIQGLISLSPEDDNVFMHLIESAPFNVGAKKMYAGVCGNLVAFACNQSYLRGTEGYVSFRSKTKLITHYEATLGAIHFGGHLMIIDTKAALKLIDKYYNS
ncbi:MAG TPA: hypothetical protein VNB90_17375 [Cytophagaceae bacterium]|nr:hypothetical protein [Cytophagaceae bacterium]